MSEGTLENALVIMAAAWCILGLLALGLFMLETVRSKKNP